MPIKTDDPAALEKLDAKLNACIKLQETMKAVNAIVQSNRGDEEKRTLIVNKHHISAESIDDLLHPQQSWHDCALDFASFSAAISGNPKLRRKVVIETRLKELDALERQYRRNVRMRQDQEKSFATLIPAMQNEINILEKFIELNPSLELGTLPIRYGLQELSGTLSQKAELLNRHIKAAFVQAAANTSFLNPDGVCKMDLLHIENLTLSMTAMVTKAFTDSNYGEIISKVMVTLEDLKVPHLPVKVTFEANDGDNIFHKLRSLINDKPKELEKSHLELSGKIARLKKLKETPMEEFSAAAEKGSLSTELDQIIYELNKTSEGQRRSYTSLRGTEPARLFSVTGQSPNLRNNGNSRWQ